MFLVYGTKAIFADKSRAYRSKMPTFKRQNKTTIARKNRKYRWLSIVEYYTTPIKYKYVRVINDSQRYSTLQTELFNSSE